MRLFLLILAHKVKLNFLLKAVEHGKVWDELSLSLVNKSEAQK